MRCSKKLEVYCQQLKRATLYSRQNVDTRFCPDKNNYDKLQRKNGNFVWKIYYLNFFLISNQWQQTACKKMYWSYINYVKIHFQEDLEHNLEFYGLCSGRLSLIIFTSNSCFWLYNHIKLNSVYYIQYYYLKYALYGGFFYQRTSGDNTLLDSLFN